MATELHEPPGEIRVEPPSDLWHALLAVQAEAPALPKDKTATVPTKSGGQYSYRYTDLATINEKVGPLLRKHMLVWTTKPIASAEGPRLAYTLAHAPSGQTLSGEMDLMLPDDATPQGQGSAITYARRYSKVAVLDLIAEEDDDGAAASGAEAAASSGVDLRDRAKGLNDAAINAARASVGLPKLERPWSSLINIPADKVEAFTIALDNARLGQ